MKQVDVTILGQVYALGCPDGGETLLASAVAAVDREMTQIRASGKVKARERIAVLAALNLAYQLAERGTAAAPSPLASASASASTTAAIAAAPPGAASVQPAIDVGEIDVDALLRRVDAALADDGQLL